MVRDLVESAIDMVRTEREAEVEDLAYERVDERLLDLLLPKPVEGAAARGPTAQPPPAPSAPPPAPTLFVVSSAGGVAKEEAADPAAERYKRTRDKLRQLLLDGQLEEREVEVEVAQPRGPMFDDARAAGRARGDGATSARCSRR